jgi:hypothetical protein
MVEQDVRFSIPSAVQQRRGEIRGSLCDCGEIWISYSNNKVKKQSMVQCIVVRQNNGNVKKHFVAEIYWVLCLEKKRCFAGGPLQSGNNHRIGSVQ